MRGEVDLDAELGSAGMVEVAVELDGELIEEGDGERSRLQLQLELACIQQLFFVFALLLWLLNLGCICVGKFNSMVINWVSAFSYSVLDCAARRATATVWKRNGPDVERVGMVRFVPRSQARVLRSRVGVARHAPVLLCRIVLIRLHRALPLHPAFGALSGHGWLTSVRSQKIAVRWFPQWD